MFFTKDPKSQNKEIKSGRGGGGHLTVGDFFTKNPNPKKKTTFFIFAGDGGGGGVGGGGGARISKKNFH